MLSCPPPPPHASCAFSGGTASTMVPLDRVRRAGLQQRLKRHVELWQGLVRDSSLEGPTLEAKNTLVAEEPHRMIHAIITNAMLFLPGNMSYCDQCCCGHPHGPGHSQNFTRVPSCPPGTLAPIRSACLLYEPGLGDQGDKGYHMARCSMPTASRHASGFIPGFRATRTVLPAALSSVLKEKHSPLLSQSILSPYLGRRCLRLLIALPAAKAPPGLNRRHRPLANRGATAALGGTLSAGRGIGGPRADRRQPCPFNWNFVMTVSK